MRTLWVIPAAMAVLASWGAAQVQQLQTGQALDANYQVGSGGYNTVNGGQGGVNSQLFVNGQVTGLGAFRGRNASGALDQFSSNLPSAGFDTFRNQSVGVQNVLNQQVYQPTYSPPSASPPMLPNLARGEVPGLALRRQPDAGLPSVYSDATADYQPLLANGPPRTPAAQNSGDIALPQLGGRASAGPGFGAPLFGAPPQLRDDLAQQLRQIAAASGKDLPSDRTPDVAESGPPAEGGGTRGDAAKGSVAKRVSGYEREGVVSPKPNQDVFVDLLVNLQARRILAGGPAEDDLSRAKPTPESGVPGAVRQTAPGKYVVEIDADKSIVVHGFAGLSPDRVNAQLKKAQDKLKAGKNYDAANDFETACIMDPNNPLPRMGEGLSLFAAGEAFSAALQFRRAMQAFPPVMETRLDLANVMNREAFDRQLAALRKRLEQHDEKDDLGLIFLATFMLYADHQDALAQGFAQRLKDLAGDDKLLTSYAQFILTGQRPAHQKPAAKK